VSSFTFVGEIINVLAVFPQSHALIVVSAVVLVADAVRIPNEEGIDFLLNTKVDHLAGGLVAHIPNTTLSPATLLVLRILKFLPAPGILLAPGLFLCDLAQLLASLVFERTDATPSDNESLARIRCHGCQVDFAQVYGRLNRSGCFFGLGYLDADMQLKTVVPDQATRTAV
jgi:hypothetical protein